MPDEIDFKRIIKDFVELAAPRLDTYETAIYVYSLKRAWVDGTGEATIGFKSARREIGLGSGTAGSPMSEATCAEKLRSLAAKGLIQILDSTRRGTTLRVLLPWEVPGLSRPRVAPPPPIEDVDFFDDENRRAILVRDGMKCFYCRTVLNSENYVIEHVISRPEGSNSYRNLVAACRQCNNRKGAIDAADFIRVLFRESLLSSAECTERIAALGQLASGALVPPWPLDD